MATEQKSEGLQGRQALEPIDAEDALRLDLTTEACPVTAPPVPDDLGASLPLACVTRDGGQRMNLVVDQHNVTVSVWSSTWAEAMRECDRIAGAVARLPMTAGTSVQWRTADITSLPSLAPDPMNPETPRAQFTATVTCRATN